MVKAPARRQRRVVDDTSTGDIYGIREPSVERFSSGCTLLDCVLGGGWGYGRMANVIGDRSTGKTLLAIEACANFAKDNPNGKIVYVEAEAAFDESYAETLGLPLQMVEFPNNEEDVEKHIQTIEDVFEDLESRFSHKHRTLYIIDSLDSLTDREEEKRAIDQNTFGQNKQKQIGALFRRMIRKFKKANITLLIISQVRDAIGVMFGEKLKRSGGKALDFYASHLVWLNHMGQISQTRNGVKRVVGVSVRVKCKKNKLGAPFRECQFPILFSYGVEDVEAGLDWLIEVKKTAAIGMKLVEAEKAVDNLTKLNDDDYRELRERVAKGVIKAWAEVEQTFAPSRRKYQ